MGQGISLNRMMMNKKRLSLILCSFGSGVCSAALPYLAIDIIGPMSAATATTALQAVLMVSCASGVTIFSYFFLSNK